LSAIFCLISPALAQNSVTLPMKTVGEHLSVEGTLNGQRLRLLLDTGAAVNVLTPESAVRLGLKLTDAPFQVSGASLTKAKLTQVRGLSLGRATLNGSFVVVPLPAALECDGILGGPFFERFVVTLDAAGGKVTLAPPKIKLTGELLPLKLKDGIPLLYGSVEGVGGWFKLDTGADDALTLFPAFVERNQLRAKFSRRIETVVGRGVGGLLTGELVKITRLSLGPHVLSGFVADLSTQESGAFADPDSAGNIGGATLRRFIVTLDYGGRRVRLLRSSLYGMPFSTNRSGLAIDFESGRALVLAVVPESPAAEQKIQPGDVLLLLDAAPPTPTRVRAALRQSAGSRVSLTLQRAGEPPYNLTLTLRDLL
jgi:hypothetical protein